MTQLLIKNAKLRYSEELTDILIKDEKIEKIEKNITADNSCEIINAGGNLVSPPIVDPHVHLDAVLVSGLLPRKNETVQRSSFW